MRTVLKWLGFGALGLVVIAALVAGLVAWRLNASLPWTTGERPVSGIASPVTIARDALGIPHIEGVSMADTLFGLGYAHAQDRFWQMDMNRRVVLGRVSELVGDQTLGTDITLRTYDFARNIDESWRTLDPEAQRLIRAYTRGINAVLSDPDFVPPPEYVLLRAEPEPWRETDSLAILKLMSLSLSGNAFAEFSRAYMIDALGADKADDFIDPPTPPLFVSLEAGDLGIVPTDEDITEQDATNDALDGLINLDGRPADQSNNWVVNAEHTTTGAPILANDPHLGTSQPGIWYLAHLALPRGNAVGTTLPGVPGIILGQNDASAWGMTNTGPDIQDLYVITVDPEDETRYQGPDGWENFEIREETIRVKGGNDVVRNYKRSRHGTVLPKDHSRFAQLAADDQEVVLAFTMNQGVDHSIVGVLALMSAESWSDMETATAAFLGPMQNLVYAHKDGDIGYLATGRAPIRGPNHDSAGLLPVDGTPARNDWQGLIPLEGMPKVLNPDSGMIVTANNRITPEGYPYSLTEDWGATERSRRIHDLLTRKDRHDLASMKEIMLDTVSLRARGLLPLLTAVPAEEGLAREARALLADWDTDMVADRPEPLIYSAWIGHLGRLIYADDLGEDFTSSWALRQYFLTSVLDGTNADWCDVTDTDEIETCDPLVARALENAVEMLSKAYGSDISNWRWDEAHQAHFDHPALGGLPVIGDWFSRSVPFAGGRDTPNVGIYGVRDMPDFPTRFTASYRAVYDLDDPSRSLLMTTTGQSGHFLSPHYDDFIARWAVGESFTVVRDMDALGDDVDRLVLTPAE